MRFKNLNIFLRKLLIINFGILKRIFLFGSLSYFCYFFLKNINEISFSIDFNKYGINIFLSFIFCLLSIYLNALAWKNIIFWFDKNNKNDNVISFYILTNILKYVPGGIWHFIERFNFLRKSRNSHVAFYATLIEPYFMLCAAFMLVTIGIVNSPVYLIFLIPLVFLNRKLIYFVLRRLELLKSKSIKILNISNSKYAFDKDIKLKTNFPLKAILIEICFVVSKFVAFFICFKVNNFDNTLEPLALLIAFCLSWSVGLIVPGAPGGLGVFEACLLFLLGQNLPQNLIIVSLIYFRLISTSADLLLSVPFLLKRIVKRF